MESITTRLHEIDTDFKYSSWLNPNRKNNPVIILVLRGQSKLKKTHTVDRQGRISFILPAPFSCETRYTGPAPTAYPLLSVNGVGQHVKNTPASRNRKEYAFIIRPPYR